MNNQEKNTYVKKQITSTLLELLQNKHLDEISVSELTREAGVGRVSFYRNYESISDICLLHNRSTESCKPKLEKVASPKWRMLQSPVTSSQER